jgi:hypothetical protein
MRTVHNSILDLKLTDKRDQIWACPLKVDNPGPLNRPKAPSLSKGQEAQEDEHHREDHNEHQLLVLPRLTYEVLHTSPGCAQPAVCGLCLVMELPQ